MGGTRAVARSACGIATAKSMLQGHQRLPYCCALADRAQVTALKESTHSDLSTPKYRKCLGGIKIHPGGSKMSSKMVTLGGQKMKKKSDIHSDKKRTLFGHKIVSKSGPKMGPKSVTFWGSILLGISIGNGGPKK